ncbi:hypothetical protein PRIPAC_89827 [Pristionchus pacificus]|uniref:Lipocln_cytosolic_FA-bd_dom domain-containing protein n=1 Tax=Pristionchus pacificus TaxID=54126 RepID=A0A2A6CVW0_PRIPA|nr:hypothetical protein PRIPAC_89827 [Pristionchus pacificus]|eukprot:PDM82268.1 hypothetical protein PRIPAC_36661 [Pristionchus pacificus]
MEQFNGRFVSDKSENFDQYLKESGHGTLVRKVEAKAIITLDIRNEVSDDHIRQYFIDRNFLIIVFPDNKWICEQQTTFKNPIMEFEIDKEFEESTTDGRKFVNSAALTDEGMLVQRQIYLEDSHKNTTITRYMEDDDTLVIMNVAEL